MININGKDIVNRIENLLKLRKESRDELATVIGKNKQVFTDWKTRNIIPTAKDLFLMAKHLGTTYDYLLLGEHDVMPDDIAAIFSKLMLLNEEERKPIIVSINSQIDYYLSLKK